MKDFKGFIFHNGISQKDVMEYLGVSKGYMSLVISGKKKLSEENFRKLIENPHGWDVSMLTEENAENSADENPEVRTLDRLFALVDDQRAEIKMLLSMLREKDEKIDELRRELDARKKETAQSADRSSAADAV